jgi:hypothetical protein
VGARNEYETVARVVKSEMRSVREWMASADSLQEQRVSIDRGKHMAIWTYALELKT